MEELFVQIMITLEQTLLEINSYNKEKKWKRQVDSEGIKMSNER